MYSKRKKNIKRKTKKKKFITGGAIFESNSDSNSKSKNNVINKLYLLEMEAARIKGMIENLKKKEGESLFPNIKLPPVNRLNSLPPLNKKNNSSTPNSSENYKFSSIIPLITPNLTIANLERFSRASPESQSPNYISKLQSDLSSLINYPNINFLKNSFEKCKKETGRNQFTSCNAYHYYSTLAKLMKDFDIEIKLPEIWEKTILEKEDYKDVSKLFVLTHLPDSIFQGKKIPQDKFTIPQTVIYIGGSCFRHCNLKKISFKNNSSLKELGKFCFADNLLEGELTLPKNLKILGDGAFLNNDLNNIFFEKGCELKKIGNSCFQNSFKNDIILDKIDFGCNLVHLEDLGSSCFADNAIKEINLPNSLINVGSGCFMNSSMSKLTFGRNLINIDNMAFYNCNLKTIDFSPLNFNIKIGNHAFFNNKIKSLNIENINEIGNFAFANNHIEELYFPEKNIKIGFKAFDNNNLNFIYNIEKSMLDDNNSKIFGENFDKEEGIYVENEKKWVRFLSNGNLKFRKILNNSNNTSKNPKFKNGKKNSLFE